MTRRRRGRRGSGNMVPVSIGFFVNVGYQDSRVGIQARY